VRAQDAPRATTARSETLRPGSYGVCAPGRSSGILERHRIRDPEDPDRRNDRKRGGRKTDHGSPVGTERGAGMGRSPRGRSAPSLIVTYPRMLISRLCAEEDRGKTPCTRARRRRTPRTAHAPGSGLLSSSLSAPRRGINTRHGVALVGCDPPPWLSLPRGGQILRVRTPGCRLRVAPSTITTLPRRRHHAHAAGCPPLTPSMCAAEAMQQGACMRCGAGLLMSIGSLPPMTAR